MEGAGRAMAVMQPCLDGCDVVRADSIIRALGLLRAEPFDAVVVDPASAAKEEMGDLLRAGRILQALSDGVAVVDADLKILWANPAFEQCCGGPVRGRGFYEALGSPQTLGPNYSPFHTALAGHIAATRLHCLGNRFLEIQVSPMTESAGRPAQLIVLSRDVTAEVQQQQILDALHRSRDELAALSPEQLAEMSVEERIELLKHDIRRLIHDLLHYDVIEIRLLDRQTGRLEPLLEEGMTPTAAQRVLYARATGNGVTGFVAATGKSYLCHDTCNDPIYIEGCAGARSSLTVPLLHEDEVIGTVNVESPKLNGFSETDLQFAEIFCREIAAALHTLELLTAEKRSTTARSIEAISREVALPVDDILTAATAVLDRYIGHDPELAVKLKQILVSARAIKQAIQKVGEDLLPARKAAASIDPTRPLLKDKRVLVADNDERVRRSAHGILGRWGCVVETARDGQEAITMARMGGYDFILADIRLPDRGGYEVYRELRQAQPEARVILMTAYGYDPSHTLVKARQDGPLFVLYKPFRIDQLLAALEGPEPAVAPPAAQPEAVRA
jgi:CheY-like chemotaxis protein